MKHPRHLRSIGLLLLAGALLASAGASTSGKDKDKDKKDNDKKSDQMAMNDSGMPRGQEHLYREVRHELVMLPNYSVFDNLGYRVSQDGVVTLYGQTTSLGLKRDAENAVKHIEGATRVDNQIEQLPPSSMDDQIRRSVLRAIYSENSPLFHYGWSTVAPIHIIVKGGHLSLEGVVDNENDKNVAEIKAKGVPNVFSVTNNLQVVNNKNK